MVFRDYYLHDVARLLELPPRAIDFLKEIIELGDDVINLNSDAKVSICEKMGLYKSYKENYFPNTSLVDQFIQILSKKGAITKVDRAKYVLNPIFLNLSEPITLELTYSAHSGREMKLTSPNNGSTNSEGSTGN